MSVNIILCSSEVTGVSPGDFNKKELKKLSEQNIWVFSKAKALKHVKSHRYKFFVVFTFSGDISNILLTAKKKNATIVEMAGLGYNDPVEHTADVYLQISKLAFKAAMNKRPGRAKKAKKREYVGSILSDDIPDTYTSNLRSVADFKEKYKIKGKGKIFLWLPGREDMIDYEFQKRLTKYVAPGDVMLAKPHPWSWMLIRKSVDRLSKIMPVVAAKDSYWGLKAMTAAVGRNSTSGIELAILRKPILYLGAMSRRPWLRKHVKAVGEIAKKEGDIGKFLREKTFEYPEEKYLKFLNRVYPSPFIPAYERICQYFESCIKGKS